MRIESRGICNSRYVSELHPSLGNALLRSQRIAHPSSMVSALKDVVGVWGEEYATRFLVRQGFSLIARNLRTAIAEVDVVLSEENTLVLCEVKTRTSARAGIAAEAIDVHRIARLRKTAELLLPDFPEFQKVRVDAVLIDVSATALSINHIRGLE